MKLTSEDQILDPGIRAKLISDIFTASESLKRKQEHIKRTEVFSDRTRDYALQLLEVEMSKDTAAEMQHRTPNISITKLVINKKARVYKDRPLRTPAKKKDKKMLDAFVDHTGFDTFMKFVNKRVELHKNILVKILPKKCLDESTPDQPLYDLGLDILNPSGFDVIEDPNDPTQPMAVILSIPRHQFGFLQDYRTGDANPIDIAKTKAGKDKSAQFGDLIYIWWSKNYHFTTDDKGKLLVKKGDEKLTKAEQTTNDFGVLPFISIAKEQEGSFWVDGGEGLVDNAILINLLLSDLNYSAKYQGTGIGYITGKDIPEKLQLGPNRFVRMKHEDATEPTPTIGFATPNPKLAENQNIIEQQLAFFLSSEGMEPGAITGKLSAGNAKSGIQEIIQKSEPIAFIEDEQQLYKDKEPEIVELAAKIIAVLKEQNVMSEDLKELANLPLELDYTLTFENPRPYANEQDLLDSIAKKQLTGLFTDEELLQDIHPDWGDEEIMAHLEKLKAMKEQKIKDQQALIPALAPDPNADPKLGPDGKPVEPDKTAPVSSPKKKVKPGAKSADK